MTPKAKEKAIELVNEFQSISGHTRFSKAYALIAVREIIKDLEESLEVAEGLHPHAKGLITASIINWLEVKQEIEKL